jgi:hypothetical protein
MEDETHIQRIKKQSLSVWKINKVALERIYHQTLVDFIDQKNSNLFFKWKVSKATGKTVTLSSKLCFNSLTPNDL